LCHIDWLVVGPKKNCTEAADAGAGMDTRLEQAIAAAVSPPVKAFLSIKVSS
jgi:hypothetical protein